MSGAVANQTATWLVVLLLARVLGSHAVGLYVQAYAVLTILVALAMFGAQTSLTRFVAWHLADDDAGALRGTLRIGMGVAATGSTTAAIGLAVLSPWLAGTVFDEPELLPLLVLTAAAIPVTAIADAALAATKGYGSMREYALVGLTFRPLSRLALTGLALLSGLGVTGALVALLVSHTLTLVLAVQAVRRRVGHLTAPPEHRGREWTRFASQTWGATLSTRGLEWADTLILGALLSAAAVGQYQVAVRLAVLTTFAALPIVQAWAPRIASGFRQHQTEALRHEYAVTTSWIVRLTAPVAVALLVMPETLLHVFGDEYGAAVGVVVLLTVGKLAEAATGPCGMVLNMARPGLNLVYNGAALGLNVTLNVLLIPRFGITGAAIAWTSSLVLLNGARLTSTWVVLRPPLWRPTVAVLPAGVAAALGGVMIRDVFAGPFQLVVTGVVILVTYALVLALTGLTTEERVLVARIGRWGRGTSTRASEVTQP